MLSRELAWETELSVAECQKRLARLLERPGFFRAWEAEQGTVFGAVDGSSFYLVAKGSPYLRNSFAPYFFGGLLHRDGTTEVRGRFRVHGFVLLFMAVWFVGVLLLGGLITAVALTELLTGQRFLQGDARPEAVVVAGPGMLLAGVALVWVGWRIGRGQRERLGRFIEETLGG